MQEPYRKGSSESILTSSLAGDIARCFLKRRQRHRWAGLLSCEKPVDQEADSIPSRRKATRQPRKSRVAVSVLRSLRTRARGETTCTRTGRSPARLGLTIKAGPRRPQAALRTCTCRRSRTVPYYL